WLRELFERQDLDLGKFIAPGYFTKASARQMPDAHRRAFFESLERSTHLSEAILKEDVGNQDARFLRGSAEGLLAAFSYTIDRSKMEAIGHAKKAYRDHRGLLAENPEYYDAYMGVGLYEYIVDNLRWYVKWLAKIVGYRGSEERGIEYLELAREKGLSVPDEASVLLMVVYFREKKNRDALAIAGELHRRFPRNFLFHLNQGQILERMRRKQDAVQTYLAVVRLAEEQRPNYQKLPLETFRYALGRRLVRLSRPDVARQQFLDCTEYSKTPARERALCHLEAGLILDEKGSREKALSHYNAVLSLPRVGDSHKKARRYLKRPYRGK
ncbi:MAG: tetratricopeptide repeat protein, partial [Vicinamibacteria bacterium]